MKRFILNTLLATICFLTTDNSLKAQCQADFSYMQNGPTTVFSDLSTVSPSWSTNYSVSWFWDFGDGNTSTQQNPIHTYSNPFLGFGILVMEILQLNKIQFIHIAMEYMPHV